MKRAEGARPQRRWQKTERPLTCMQCESDDQPPPPKISFIMGDSNDFEGLVFHGFKLTKVRGRGTSGKGRTVLHQAANEGRLGWLRKDFAQRRMPSQQLALEAILEICSAKKEIMADVEAQKFECLTSLSGLFRKWMRGFARWSIRRDGEQFVRVERHISSVASAPDSNKVCRE